MARASLSKPLQSVHKLGPCPCVLHTTLTCGGYISISICHNGLWRFLHDLSLHWLNGILPKLLRLFSVLDLNVTEQM